MESLKLVVFKFQTLILGFSKVLEFTKTKNRLPNYLSLNVKSTSKLNTVIPKYNSNNGNNSNTNKSTGNTNNDNNTGNDTGSSSNVKSKQSQ